MTNTQLSEALRLTPLTDGEKTMVEFLMELKDHPEWADTAHALVLRSILTTGEEKVDEEKDSERRVFLQGLKDAGIRSFRAFHHVCGSQLFAERLLAGYLTPAAGRGAQLKKFLIIEGGPGSGKDFFKEGIERALETHAKVYAVKGCPEHENPLNLLRLLTPEQRQAIAEATGIGCEQLTDLMAAAGTPCQHCYDTVMGTVDKPNPEPSLAEVKVESVRLSKRSVGVAEYKPGATTPLIAALRRANRGYVSLEDAFIERELVPGETDERLILLSAAQYRTLPGVSKDENDVVAPSPLDVLIWCTTNRKALTTFLETLPDREAFTGRSLQLKLPYNLIRVEEERAYRREMATYKERASFDPLALKMVATLAVLSRYAVPKDGDAFVHPIDRMRLLNGERIQVKPRTSSDYRSVWAADTGSSSGGYSGGYSSGYGSGYGRTQESTPAATGPFALPIPADAAITGPLMWSLIGPEEGLQGLDMRFMLSLVSSLNSIGLKKAGKEGCVTALEAIMILRMAIHREAQKSNLTDEQKAVLNRCQKWLGGVPKPDDTWTASATTSPGLIESEYRRLLKGQILQVFSPDYAERAQELYDEYMLHAVAWAQKEQKVKHPKLRAEVGVNTALLDELDRYRLGKAPGSFLSDEDREFRNGVKTEVSEAKDDFVNEALKNMAEELKDADEETLNARRKELRAQFTETWETIPELATAIRAKLDAKVGEAVEKLLTTEVTSNLKPEELARLAEAKRLFEQLGYCPASMKPVLEYAKRVKVWAHKA